MEFNVSFTLPSGDLGNNIANTVNFLASITGLTITSFAAAQDQLPVIDDADSSSDAGSSDSSAAS